MASAQPARWSPALSAPRKIRKRVLASRLLAGGILLFALLARDVYAAGSPAQLALESAAFLLLLAGAMGRIWASAHISGRKGRVLVREGPYSMIRNPLYFFTLLAHVGAGLAFQSLAIALLMAGAFFVTHWGTVLEEERWLHEVFGGEFEDYARRVPRFLPKPWLLSSPELIAVEPARFSRALRESSLILLVFPLALVVDWCHASALLPILFRVP